MCPSPRLVCSNRPEGRVLSCLDPPATQAIPAFRVRGTGVSVQGPALRAVPVASRLHQSRGGGPCPPERTRCAHSQLPRRLAHTRTVSQAVVCTQGPGAQAPQPAGPLGQLGKEQTRANAEFDSVNQTARLTQERAQSVLNCFKTLSGRTAVPLKLFQRLLGHMAAAAVTVPLGLLHMRPLQHWLYGRIPRWVWKRGTYRVQITPACRKTFRPWSDPSFLRAGVPLEQVSRHAVVFTDGALTITSAWAPSTRRAYTLKWNLFVEWCSSHQEDPRRCSIRAVLSFLQQGLERRLSPSTLKVYVAAISAYHDPVEGKSVGKHNLVVRFLRGARRLNPPRPPSLPSWDLALVLRALITAPFEPLQSVELKFLSMKTLLLTALASIKRVGDLQAFSVDDSCLQFGPADSSATLRPRPGYVPKVPTTPFRDQVVNLQALPPEEADPALALLCPVRALRQYTDRTQSFRTSEQLFVCYGGQQKGKAVSKQRMAHWIVDAITLAYEAQGVPCPLRLRAHSTRGVASSWALARGASLADICRAAGWATPNTFARFYSLRVEPVSSCVLTSNG